MSQAFFQLSTDEVLNTLERILGRTSSDRRATGYILPLNSVENRVFEVEFEDGVKVVAKFYRPQRWTREQLLEEHLFLYALEKAEIPVVTPLRLSTSGDSLSETRSGIFVCVFPKVRGRLRDELDDSCLRTLGRYLGRIHRVARELPVQHRISLNVENYGDRALDQLDARFFENEALRSRYFDAAERILDVIEPSLARTKFQLVHGDCHLGNVLWQEENPFFLDFDDSCFAPVVQDIWMTIRGRDEDAIQKRRVLLEGYEVMNEFPWQQLSLIEPLRALRIIHHSAWIAERWEDPSFPKLFPAFGTSEYWREEIHQLDEIFQILTSGASDPR